MADVRPAQSLAAKANPKSGNFITKEQREARRAKNVAAKAARRQKRAQMDVLKAQKQKKQRQVRKQQFELKKQQTRNQKQKRMKELVDDKKKEEWSKSIFEVLTKRQDIDQDLKAALKKLASFALVPHRERSFKNFLVHNVQFTNQQVESSWNILQQVKPRSSLVRVAAPGPAKTPAKAPGMVKAAA